MATLLEKREKRGTAIANARKLTEKADAEKRSMTVDESKEFDAFMLEGDKLHEEIRSEEGDSERRKRLSEAEKTLATKDERRTTGDHPGTTPGGGKSETRTSSWKVAGGGVRTIKHEGRRGSDEYREGFERFLASGTTRGMQMKPEGSNEVRDLAADDDVAGGYLLAPMQVVATLLQAVDDAVMVRQHATVIQMRTAQSLGVPSLDTDLNDSDWTSEVAAVTNDTAMTFGRRELAPSPISKLVKISRKLIRQAQSVESIVNQRLGYKFGVTEEKAFLTGSGANQPLGLYTASANGISTARDQVCGSTTEITADGLIDVKFALKAQYWNRSHWMFHRTALKQIRKLKDSTNQYLWQPGLQAGLADQILDRPYLVSEFNPNTFTTGQYVLMFGDLSFYWIAEGLNLEIQRLDQLYAANNQIGYIGRQEVDGMPVLGEAFVRGKLG